MMKSVVVILCLALGMSLMLIRAQPGRASSSGIAGWSGNPAQGGLDCNACHGGGASPGVLLSGPTSVASGQTATYVLALQSANPAGQTAAGLNVSATGGLLASAGPDTQVLSAEIAHTAPKANDGSGLAAFSFLWTAPSHPTQVTIQTLYAAGNSVNLNGNPGGDKAATHTLTVSVAPTCAAAPAVAVSPVISAAGGNVNLSWVDYPANSGGYEIHRSTTPYFTPGPATLLNALAPGATSYQDTGASGNPAINYVYLVRARNCTGSLLADSFELGEFDLTLQPGALY